MTEKSHQLSRRQTDAAQHGGGRRFCLILAHCCCFLLPIISLKI